MKTTAAGARVATLLLMLFAFQSNGVHSAPLVDEGCDPVTPKPVCPAPNENVEFTKSCPVGGYCAPSNSLPIAELECHSDSGIAWCEAWSQADGSKYQYLWSSSGAVGAPVSPSPDTPLASADCTRNRGWVTVTVVNVHTGASRSATVVVFCEGNQ